MKPSNRFGRLSLLALLLAIALALGFAPAWRPAGFWLPPSQTTSQPLAEGRGPRDFVPGELLIEAVPGVHLDVSSLRLGYPVTEEGVVAPLGIMRLGVPVGREREIARLLRQDPRVEWCDLDYLRNVMMVPNDQLYHQFQWDLQRIHAEQAWDVTTGSPDVTVAVLDTGVDSSHPDLTGKLVPGYDFLHNNPYPEDDSGHGTHSAGIIGAASNNGIGITGIAWGARIMPIKVLNSSGVGPDSAISKGIIYAADHGAKVINMSFGNPMSSQLLARAIQYAYDKGVVLVAAAGNSANQGDEVIYPAAYNQVLAVGATDEADNVPDFSQHHSYVGISAPGVGIVSTFWRGAGYGDYVAASGTSAAAPHVSGVAALVRSVNPELSASQVVKILENTADDLGVPGRDEYYGAGLVDAYRAVMAAKLGTTSYPTATPVPAGKPQPTSMPPQPLPTPVAARSRTTWYFAEGSTAPPFDLWLLLQNPNPVPVTARVTYMKTDGSQQIQDVYLDPSSRKSIYVNQVIPRSELSMKVESDSLVLAERAMYFRTDGHDTVGARAPSTRWYMAEGSTKGDFETWILLQNPQSSQANVTLTFLTGKGQRQELSLVMPPTSRRSIYLNQVIPDADVSTMITSDQPIVAERSMYFRHAGGTGGLASNRLAKVWYLAEGMVGQGLDDWLLAMNPNPTVANLKVTYMREDGSTQIGYYSIQPWSRFSLYLNKKVPAGRLGAKVESDQPIEVERSTYFAGGRGGTSVVASPALSEEWYLPEGSTKAPFTEEIAVLNPGNQAAKLAVTFMKNDGTTDTRYFTMARTSRLTLRVNDLEPDTELSARVTSDSPIAVERSMYFANGLGGTDSFGIPR